MTDKEFGDPMPGTSSYGSPELQPLGTFHAVHTRDAVAFTRDGWPYFEAFSRGTNSQGESLIEIRFGDGEWMLAAAADLWV